MSRRTSPMAAGARRLLAALLVGLALACGALPSRAQAPSPGGPALAPMARTTGPEAARSRPGRINLLSAPSPPAGAARPRETRQLVIGVPGAVAVGALLGGDEQPLAPEGAYSIVLADRSPRTVALCRAMTQGLAFIDPARATPRPQQLRPIYWLLARPGTELAAMGEVTCEALVDNLDLLRAGAAALDGHEGPKLRAILLRGDDTVVDVLWDLSGQPESEFRRAVGLWADLMGDDPAGWESRVRRLQLVEDFRGFLIHVGEPLSNLLGVRAATGQAPAHVIRIDR